MDGVLVIDKPVGPTSHDVVAAARRTLRLPRVGHTGTLDPFASGVLPLVVGRATRLAQFLTAGPKSYRATMCLGRATTTYDRTGRDLPVVEWVASPGVEGIGAARTPADIPDSEIEASVRRFAGTFAQRPPIYSAKKVEGQKAYELARANQRISLEPVLVSLHSCHIVARDGDMVELDLECAAGFYVRSLAHDIGVALGCGAHLAELRRTRSAGFGLEDAITLDNWSQAERKLVSLERLLPWLACVTLTAGGHARVRQGQPARPGDIVGGIASGSLGGSGTGSAGGITEGSLKGDIEGSPEDPVRLLSPQGALVGLARRAEDGLLHPFLNLV